MVPGRHDPLVTEAEFEAAHRGHVPGRRRGSDLLTGRVRCGQCGRINAIDTNGADSRFTAADTAVGAAEFPADPPLDCIGLLDWASSCCEPMTSCSMRSARISPGTAERAGGGSAEPIHAGAMANLRRKRDKLLQLFLDDKITKDYFSEQERQLSAKITALEGLHAEALLTGRQSNALVEAFERAAALLRDPAFESTRSGRTPTPRNDACSSKS